MRRSTLFPNGLHFGRLQGGNELRELLAGGRIEKSGRGRDDLSHSLRGVCAFACRCIHRRYERRPEGRRQREGRQPVLGVRRPLDPGGRRQPSVDYDIVHEPRGNIRGECNLALSADRRAAGERGERGEAKIRGGQRVRRLSDEHSGS